MDIQTVDPLAPLYNVSGFDDVRAYKKSDVEDVNYLIRISHGKRDSVKSLEDWEIVAKLFEFWTRKWPYEWDEFGKSIIDIRRTRARKDGKSTTGEIKYVGALPARFMKLIQIIFPEQKFNKKFVYELTKRIKIIKVGEKHDTWFLI